MERKIITTHVYPPIPTRTMDWCAYYDGEEEAGHYGWGRTEDDAIADFKENYAEDHDERLAPVAPVAANPLEGWVATVVWNDPLLEWLPPKPGKIIDASLAFMDSAQLGTKLYPADMVIPRLPADAVADALHVSIEKHGSYASLARATDLSDEYIRQAANGTRPITGKLLKFLGFERVISYKKVIK